MPVRKRDYKRERLMESPRRRKERAMRNKARRAAIKSGKIKKGDKTKQVDHKKPLRSGGSNAKSNWRIRSTKANISDNGGRGGRPKGGRKKSIPRGNRHLKK